MKKNLVQKFRKFYYALPQDEQKALFAILTALRGEDSRSSTFLKIFTTARIRGALFGKSQKDFCKRALCFASFKKAKAYNTDGYFPPVPTQLMKNWRQADSHFKQHIQSAIEALKKRGFKRSISDLMNFI